MTTRSLNRRRSDFQKTGNERWLVSYADFITLLFGFFVVMYSISQVNEEKYRLLTETFGQAFSNGVLSDSKDAADDVNSSGVDVNLAELSALSETIQQGLVNDKTFEHVRVNANENWLELTLNSELLFDSGKAEINALKQTVFAPIAALLAPYRNEIQVLGHTDSIPIRNKTFANNWALSSARAVAIVDTLVSLGVSPDRLSAVGNGEFRPVADNATADGRARNRRVVLRVANHASAASKKSSSGGESALDNPATDTTLNRVDGNRPIAGDSVPGNTQAAVKPSTVELNSQKSLEELERSSAIKPIRLKNGNLLFTNDPDRLKESPRE